ncbi:MAG: GntR family transcriptional regulator [Acidobacteria bacterium]|nr:GntR family transcriptional regulator [Acidobacteriota bacterium]
MRSVDALPGTRPLARDPGVQRLTVVAAFDELFAEGWIVNQPARGAFVSGDLPDRPARRFSPRELPAVIPERTGYDLLAGSGSRTAVRSPTRQPACCELQLATRIARRPRQAETSPVYPLGARSPAPGA